MKRLLASLVLLYSGIVHGQVQVVGCEGVGVNLSSDRTVDVPSGTQDGHTMVAWYSHHTTDIHPITLSGWTQHDNGFNTDGTSVASGLWTKTASSEPSSYTFDAVDATSSGNNGTAIICTFSGADGLDVTYVRENHFTRQLNDSTPTAQPITTQTNGAMVVVWMNIPLNNVSAMVCPSSGGTWNEEIEVDGGGSRHANICTHTQATAGTVTPGASNHTDLAATDDAVAITIAIKPAAEEEGPEFTANPTVTNVSDTAVTFSYTASASGDTIYGSLRDTADGAFTCDEIEAETATHGPNSEATTGSADSIILTSSDTPEFPIYDADFCIEDSEGNDSDVFTVSDIEMDAPSGKQFVAITSIGTDSPCDAFNDAANPDIANGDYLLADDATDPGDYALTIGADCHYSYTGDGRQSVLDTFVYDASVGAWHAEDLDVWFNNTAPECTEDTILFLFDEDEEAPGFDLSLACEDADSDTLTFSVSSGSLPTGLALSGTGNATLGSTPTTENESGASVTFTATDIAGDTDTFATTIYVVNTVTLADYTEGTLSEAIAQHRSDFPWQEDDLSLTASFSCSDEDENEVISQDPAADSEVEPFGDVTIRVSTGSECPVSGPGKTRARVTMNGVSL